MLGGTRASSFWRWPGTLKPADVDRLAAHVDFFPTIAADRRREADRRDRAQVEGRSLVPLLADPKARGPTAAVHAPRPLAEGEGGGQQVRRVRRPHGPLAPRQQREGREEGWQLFDVKADPGEKATWRRRTRTWCRMERAYDRWWDSVQPRLVNEKAVGPKVNPFRELYEDNSGRERSRRGRGEGGGGGGWLVKKNTSPSSLLRGEGDRRGRSPHPSISSTTRSRSVGCNGLTSTDLIPDFQAAGLVLRHRVRGHRDDRRAAAIAEHRSEASRRLDAVHHRHLDVHQDQVESAPRHGRKDFVARDDENDLVPALPEDQVQQRRG